MMISGTGQRISIRVDAAVENHGLFCSGSAKRKNGFFVGSDMSKTSLGEKNGRDGEIRTRDLCTPSAAR
tara:strand:- start:324 stop:530 length:207 start_codon:yes stop_codon:yes gene_type:complete